MTLFDLLKELQNPVQWEDRSEEFKKIYNPFMINRFVSSIEACAPFIAEITLYNSLSPKVHYTFLQSFVANRRFFFNYKAYKKNKKEYSDDILENVKKYFEIGNKDLEEYMQFLSDKDITQIHNLYQTR